MSGLYSVENGKLTINLHPGQTRAWDSKARYTFIIAGTQSGKTSFLPMWLDREMRDSGPGDYIAVTATYDLFKLKFLPEMKRYFCDLFQWQYAASDRVIWKGKKEQQYRIVLRSANAEGGLESLTGKAAVLDECGQDDFTLEAWEAIQRRLSLSRGRVLGGTTPYNLGWLKTQVFDRWRGGDKDYQVVQFASTMNPAFPRDEYESKRLTLPTWKFEMFYNGNFSRPAGLIYEDFTEWHICDPFNIPPEWPRWLGVDPGAVHTAKIWIVMDPATKVYYVVADPLDGNMTTKEQVNTITGHRLYQKGLTATGGAPSEKQPRMDWGEAGLPLHEPSITDVESGIDRVIALFKEKRLRIFNTCTGIIDELGTYARQLDETGQPTEIIANKARYHRLDGLRYGVIGLSDMDINWGGMQELGHVEDYQSPWAEGGGEGFQPPWLGSE